MVRELLAVMMRAIDRSATDAAPDIKSRPRIRIKTPGKT